MNLHEMSKEPANFLFQGHVTFIAKKQEVTFLHEARDPPAPTPVTHLNTSSSTLSVTF